MHTNIVSVKSLNEKKESFAKTVQQRCYKVVSLSFGTEYLCLDMTLLLW